MLKLGLSIERFSRTLWGEQRKPGMRNTETSSEGKSNRVAGESAEVGMQGGFCRRNDFLNGFPPI